MDKLMSYIGHKTQNQEYIWIFCTNQFWNCSTGPAESLRFNFFFRFWRMKIPCRVKWLWENWPAWRNSYLSSMKIQHFPTDKSVRHTSQITKLNENQKISNIWLKACAATLVLRSVKWEVQRNQNKWAVLVDIFEFLTFKDIFFICHMSLT